MLEQIDFSQTSEFRNFMERLSNLKAAAYVHGVFIDIHPVWQAIVDYQRAAGISPNDESPTLWTLPQERQRGRWYELGPEAAPRAWLEFCDSLKKDPRYPFVVTLWVLPVDREHSERYRELVQYSFLHAFFVRLQERPMAALATGVGGASEMTASRGGALGGFLEDHRGRRWGVTCGHVAQVAGDPFTLEDVGGVQYVGAGTVAQTNFPTLTPAHSGLCNPYVSGGNPDTDGALLELDKSYTSLNSVRGLGKIDEIFDRTRLNSGSPVCMSGVKSAVEDYVIGGYGVTLKVSIKLPSMTAYYCFSDLFEFYDAGPGIAWMPAKAVQAAAARPLQGDSGSWVCFRKETAVCAYFGNLIAIQGLTGIATFADSFIDWAQTQHGLTLSVF
jgi:hypothetical protein